MIDKVLHGVAANSIIYDLIQRLAGVQVVHETLAAQIEKFAPLGNVLDVGGGTGMAGYMWPASCQYICLDIDPRKLTAFHRKYPNGRGLLGDAADLPVRSGGVELVQYLFVMHHIPDDRLARLFRESVRALSDGGKIIVVDPLWAPGRWASRLLWKYDRGSYPRRPETLHDCISAHFSIRYWERFAVYHEYVICVAEKK